MGTDFLLLRKETRHRPPSNISEPTTSADRSCPLRAHSEETSPSVRAGIARSPSSLHSDSPPNPKDRSSSLLAHSEETPIPVRAVRDGTVTPHGRQVQKSGGFLAERPPSASRRFGAHSKPTRRRPPGVHWTKPRSHPSPSKQPAPQVPSEPTRRRPLRVNSEETLGPPFAVQAACPPSPLQTDTPSSALEALWEGSASPRHTPTSGDPSSSARDQIQVPWRRRKPPTHLRWAPA